MSNEFLSYNLDDIFVDYYKRINAQQLTASIEEPHKVFDGFEANPALSAATKSRTPRAEHVGFTRIEGEMYPTRILVVGPNFAIEGVRKFLGMKPRSGDAFISTRTISLEDELGLPEVA